MLDNNGKNINEDSPNPQSQEQLYQGQSQDQSYHGQSYQGQPQGQPYQGQGQAQFIKKPKEPFALGKMVQALFSSQPYNVFKVQQDKLSTILILALAILFGSLSNAGSAYRMFSWKFYIGNTAAFFLVLLFSLISFAILYGAMFGYGLLIQGKDGNSKIKSKTTLETLAASTIPTVALYVLAFIFSFFWGGGYGFLAYAGLFINIILYLEGLELKLGEKANKFWYKIALVAVALLLFVVI